MLWLLPDVRVLHEPHQVGCGQRLLGDGEALHSDVLGDPAREGGAGAASTYVVWSEEPRRTVSAPPG